MLSEKCAFVAAIQLCRLRMVPATTPDGLGVCLRGKLGESAHKS